MALPQVAMSPPFAVRNMRWPVILVILSGLIGCSDGEPPAPADPTPFQAPPPPTVAKVTEKDLCVIVDQHRTRYRDVMERDGYLDQQRDLSVQVNARATRLRDVLKDGSAVGWSGEVSRLQRTLDGSAALSIRLPCKATLVSVLAVPESSPLSPTLRLKRQNTPVVFSGHLVERKAGESGAMYQRAWFREASISDWGSMNEPEFAFVFEKISP